MVVYTHNALWKIFQIALFGLKINALWKDFSKCVNFAQNLTYFEKNFKVRKFFLKCVATHVCILFIIQFQLPALHNLCDSVIKHSVDNDYIMIKQLLLLHNIITLTYII